MHYFNEKGDNITVKTEKDLQIILNKIKEKKNVKLYITEKFTLQNIPLTSSIVFENVEDGPKVETPKRIDGKINEQFVHAIMKERVSKKDIDDLDKLLDADDLSQISGKLFTEKMRGKAKKIAKKLIEDHLTSDEKNKLMEKLQKIKSEFSKEDLEWFEKKILKLNKEKIAKEKLMKESISNTMIENMESWLSFLKTKQDSNYSKEDLTKLFEEFTNNYNNLDKHQQEIIDMLLNRTPSKIKSVIMEKSNNKPKNLEIIKEEVKEEKVEVPLKPIILVEHKEDKKAEIKIEKKYSDDVKVKARTLKEIFPESNTDKLYEFAEKNKRLNINELIELYLSN